MGVGAAIKVAGDFEAQLNTINTIVKLSDQDLTKLGQGIRATFRETGAPLEELTAAYYDLLSAGVKVGDAQGVLNTAVKLGIGGLATTKEAADLLTTAINAYGLSADQAAQASDIFAAAVRDGKVTVSELNASFADVAPLAATVGVKLEEIGAAYATLTARGVPATEVGTQFNRAIIELLKPGPELVGIMKDMGLASFEASIKQKGLVQTLEDIRVEAQKQGVPFQDLFGRLEAYKFALATTGPAHDKFIASQKAMGESTGETAAQFAERQKGLNFQLGVFKALATDAGITIGEALLPKLVPLLERLNTFIVQNQDKIATFGQKLADGFGGFAAKLQGVDFTGVISGLKLLGDVGKKVVDIFLSLPPGIQGALVAGFAVNKLSGGLIGSGIGNVAGGLLKMVFSRGETPARPLYTWNVNGGGGSGPGGTGLTIVKLLGLASAAYLGLEIGKGIGNFLGLGQGVSDAVEHEQEQFVGFVSDANKTAADIQSKLDANLRAQTELSLQAAGGFGPLIFGDQVQVLKDQEAVLRDQLAALDNIDAATLKYGVTAERQARAVEALKLPLGLGNAIAQQIRDKGAVAVEEARQTKLQAANIARYTAMLPEPSRLTALQTATAARMTERTLEPLWVTARKNPSFVANTTVNVNARLSVTQSLYTQTLYNSIKGDNLLDRL